MVEADSKIEDLRDIYNLIPIFLTKLGRLYANVISINMVENYKNGDPLESSHSFWL